MANVTTYGIYLYNANVNNGNSIWLKDVIVTRGVKRLITLKPTVGKSSNGKYLTHTPIRLGIDFPSITIEGRIDKSDTSTNEIDEKLFFDLLREETADYYLTIAVPNPLKSSTGITSSECSPSYLGSNDTNLGQTNNIKCELISGNYRIDAKDGNIISYTLEFVEVA